MDGMSFKEMERRLFGLFASKKPEIDPSDIASLNEEFERYARELHHEDVRMMPNVEMCAQELEDFLNRERTGEHFKGATAFILDSMSALEDKPPAKIFRKGIDKG